MCRGAEHSFSICGQLIVPFPPPCNSRLTGIILILLLLFFCEVICNYLLYGFSTVMLKWNLVIRQQTEGSAALSTLTPFNISYQSVSPGFLLSPFHPFLRFQSACTVWTNRILFAPYSKDVQSSLYSSQNSDIIMGMVLHHGSRRWHRAKEVSGIFLSLALSDIISINSVTINEINFLSNQIGNNSIWSWRFPYLCPMTLRLHFR